MSVERLDKLLASQGMKGRSDVKRIISAGRVTINGVVVKSAGIKTDSESDIICIDGKQIFIEKYVYYIMNKPAGVVCATNDNISKTVIDIIPPQYRRKDLFPVGRLDRDTEGLLLITNDGQFAHNITAPSKKIYKTYYVEIDSEINQQDIEAFEQGIVFKDGTVCKKAYLSCADSRDSFAVKVKICEGMFHQVKKMLAVRGKKVLYLKRIAIGNLFLDNNLNKGDVKKVSFLDISNKIVGEMH